MISTATALYNFFSGFDLPAYNESTIPDDAELPYIVYQLVEPEWSEKTIMYVRVYYRNKTSNFEALQKADEIAGAVGVGIRLDCQGGYVVLRPETPLIQPIPPENDIHGALVTLQINSFHLAGM